MILTTRATLIALSTFAAAAVTPVCAQTAAQSSAPVPIPSRTYVGFNPIGLPADIGTFEIESGVAPGITLGGVASYIDVSDSRFTTFDFKVRYYPAEVVLRGFSVGATGGYTRFSNRVSTPLGDSRESLSAPTLGIILDYNWIYGRTQHFIVGTGVGAKRVLASSADRDRANVDRAIVTARLIIGFAF